MAEQSFSAQATTDLLHALNTCLLKERLDARGLPPNGATTAPNSEQIIDCLERGADPNAFVLDLNALTLDFNPQDKQVGTMTPLFQMIQAKDVAIVAALLEHGADPNLMVLYEPKEHPLSMAFLMLGRAYDLFDRETRHVNLFKEHRDEMEIQRNSILACRQIIDRLIEHGALIQPDALLALVEHGGRCGLALKDPIDQLIAHVVDVRPCWAELQKHPQKCPDELLDEIKRHAAEQDALEIAQHVDAAKNTLARPRLI